jgi:hypothetical protein
MLSRKHSGFILIVLACLLPIEAVGQHCGVERWSVKTGTDAGASQLDLTNPQATTIADLIALPAPNPLPTDTRFSPTENTVFVLSATLTDFKLETGAHGDSDYHLVLMDDQGNTMVGEIPSPDCVGAASPFAAQIASARAQFDSQFTPTSSFQTANVPVQVTGVGFFDFFHNQHGVAPNVIEIHPILSIQFNPQPGSGDFAVSTSTTAMHLHGGGSSSINLSAVPVGGGSTPAVTFATSGLPPGVSSRITPTGEGKAVLSVSANAGVPSGTFPVTITGSTKRRSHTQTVALNLSGPPETTTDSQWEYKTITATTEQDVIQQANALGADDWEMVSVVRISGSRPWQAFFKRRRKD